MLNPKEAEKELSIGEKLNPVPWIKHSMSVGINAKLILLPNIKENSYGSLI